MKLRVETSGFSHKVCKGAGRLCPADLPDREMPGYYAGRFDTVEVNDTFYRMPPEKALEGRAARAPETFRFVLEASRRIMHLGRIGDVKDSVDYLVGKASNLGERLGQLLSRLPPFMRKDTGRLMAFLAMPPDGVRAAMEFRNISWFDDEVFDALRERDVALCFADGEMREEIPVVSTASWGYLGLRRVERADAALHGWVEPLRGQSWDEDWVFFKHEDAGPKLAARFLELFEA